MNLEQILLEAIPPVQNCEIKNRAATEARKIAKQRIEELYKRDMSQPFKPELEYKK